MLDFPKIRNSLRRRFAKKNIEYPVQFIAGDIVNQCNLRCPFCLVDYTNTSSLKLMTDEVYNSLMVLLPLTPPGGFWLSCLHEPTLHPRFIDFIEATPRALRDRISFTTNLTLRLSDEFLDRLVASGVHQIRVSLDSRQADVFAKLRKKGKYQVFDDNLRRLCERLAVSRTPPQLHFITMAFKDNKNEIADLVRYGREVGGNTHEVRFPYYVPSIVHWAKEHNVDKADWLEIERDVHQLGLDNILLYGPTDDVVAAFEQEHGVAGYVAPRNAFGDDIDLVPLRAPAPETIGNRLPDEPLMLRLRWDGLVGAVKAPDFGVTVKTLPEPVAYFNAVRRAARQDSRKQYAATA